VASGDIAGNLTLGGSINGGLRVVTTVGTPNILAGFSGNTIAAGVVGGTISGGGDTPTAHNRVTDDFGTVAGGNDNQAGNGGSTTDVVGATVGGGRNNDATGMESTIAGGSGNAASGPGAAVAGGSNNNSTANYAAIGGGNTNAAAGNFSTVGGGFGNTAGAASPAKMEATVAGGGGNVASGDRSAVGGGRQNTASGDFSTIPGGHLNDALAPFTFAAGRRASAIHDGAFVWGDSFDADIVSSAVNEFTVRAGGGVRFLRDTGGGPQPLLTVNSLGEVTATKFIGDGSMLTNLPGGGGGTVTQVNTGTGLTGGPITGSGTIALSQAALTRGIVYIAGCETCQFLVDSDDQPVIYQNVIGQMTIQSVTCFSDADTPTINLKRNGSADVVTGGLSCAVGGNSTSTIAAATLNVDDRLDFHIVSVATNATRRITVVIKAVLN
jgi:hypothetical protein